MKVKKWLDTQPHTKKILKEMCKVAKVDFNKENFDTEQWFTKHSWNEKQEKQFRKWAIDYLYNNSGARQEILSINLKDKKLITKAVNWFIFQYGWKYE